MLYRYPYTNLYNLNLDWLIQAVSEIQDIIAPLENGLVNSVNGMTGDVVITKAMLIQILENLVSTFNGRTGDVVLTAEDVNATLIDITWTSDPGDTIADLTQTEIDQLFLNGKRVLIFVNSQGVADKIYFLQYYDNHAQPQAVATVESFNGRTGDVELTAADVNGTMIELIWASDPGDTIGDLSQEDLDAMYLNGKRVLLFTNSDGIAEQVYFLLYYGGHAQPQVLAAVPASRTVNGKALTSNITINASDVPSMAMAAATDVDAALKNLNFYKVPTSRTVNNKALTANITLNDGDIPSEAVSDQTTVQGALTDLDQRASSQAQQIVNVAGAIAIFISSNIAPAGGVTAGKYYIWDGYLRKATNNIAAGETLTDSNMPIVPNGGLNDLNTVTASAIENLDTNIVGHIYKNLLTKYGEVKALSLTFVLKTITDTTWRLLGTYPDGFQCLNSYECKLFIAPTKYASIQAVPTGVYIRFDTPVDDGDRINMLITFI